MAYIYQLINHPELDEHTRMVAQRIYFAALRGEEMSDEDSHADSHSDSHADSHYDSHSHSHGDSHGDSHADSHVDSHADSHAHSHSEESEEDSDSHEDSHDSEDMERALRQLIEAIGADEATRMRAVRDVLMHARQTMEDDEDRAGEIFYMLLHAIMEQRNEQVRNAALVQVLEFIGNIDDEDDQGTVFGHMLWFILHQDGPSRESAFRFVINAIRMDPDERSRQETLAFILHVISQDELDAHTRSEALRIFFDAVQHQGSDEDMSDSSDHDDSRDDDDDSNMDDGMLEALMRQLAERLVMVSINPFRFCTQ